MALKLDGAINKIYLGSNEVPKAFLGLIQVYPEVYQSTTFDTRWVIPSNNYSVTLPLVSGQPYNGTIDWGDGTTVSLSYANRQHTYTTAGNYIIKIDFNQDFVFGFSTSSLNRDDIVEILSWGDSTFRDIDFKNCDNLLGAPICDDTPLFSSSTVNSMFFGCTSLETIRKIEDWDVTGIKDFNLMFISCHKFNDALTNWTTSIARTMDQMFKRCYLFNQPLNHFVTDGVEIMSEMFLDCFTFNQPLNLWNVSSNTDFSNMFNDSAFLGDISGWNVSNGVDFGGMFKDTSFNIDISGWNMTNATRTKSMFDGNTVFNQDISAWDVSSVTDMQSMFEGAIAFNQDIGSWDFSSVTSIQYFMDGKDTANYNPSYYDSLLSAFVLGGQFTLALRMGTIKYTSSGASDRATLVTNRSWNIIDGGQI